MSQLRDTAEHCAVHSHPNNKPLATASVALRAHQALLAKVLVAAEIDSPCHCEVSSLVDMLALQKGLCNNHSCMISRDVLS